MKGKIREAVNRLLGCFGSIDTWPKIITSRNNKWSVGMVDDTTRDAIQHVIKIMKEG